MNKIIALDFDGVICDSIDECLLVSYFAFNNISSILKINFSDINKNLISSFRKYRFIVGPAKDFFFLWKSLIANTSSPDNVINDFLKLQKLEKNLELPFVKKFYSLRKDLKNNNFHYWLSLNPIFAKVKNFLLEFSNKNLFIITAKDYQSVDDIMKANDIEINSNHIYGIEIDLDKRNLFKKMINDFSLNKEDILFIDDNISNLMKVKKIGILGYLATWGYNSSSDYNKAQNNNIPSLKLDDLYSII